MRKGKRFANPLEIVAFFWLPCVLPLLLFFCADGILLILATQPILLISLLSRLFELDDDIVVLLSKNSSSWNASGTHRSNWAAVLVWSSCQPLDDKLYLKARRMSSGKPLTSLLLTISFKSRDRISQETKLRDFPERQYFLHKRQPKNE